VRRCAGCGKLYWAGTHHDRMSAMIRRVVRQDPTGGPGSEGSNPAV
jgi:uncharacterized protein with PIN domain